MVARRHLADLVRAAAQGRGGPLSLLRLGRWICRCWRRSPRTGMHITVQRMSPLPDPIEAEMAHLLDAVEEQLPGSMPSTQRSRHPAVSS